MYVVGTSYCTVQSSNIERLINLIIDLCNTGTKNVSPEICTSSSKSGSGINSQCLFSHPTASFCVLCLPFVTFYYIDQY